MVVGLLSSRGVGRVAGRVVVSLPALEVAVGDLSAGIAQVEGSLADLRVFLAPMVGSWSGSAAQAYGVLQREWDTAADLQASLAQVHGVVARAHVRYGHAETTNTGIWSG